MVEAKPVRDSAKVTSTTELVPARQRERYTRKHRKLLCHYHFIIMTMIIVMIFFIFPLLLFQILVVKQFCFENGIRSKGTHTYTAHTQHSNK